MALQDVSLPVLPIIKAHLIINCVLVAIALIVLGFRVSSRLRSGARLCCDDYFVLAAAPQVVGMLVIQGFCRLMSSTEFCNFEDWHD